MNTISEYLACDHNDIGAVERHLRGIAEEATMAQRPREWLFKALDKLSAALTDIEEVMGYLAPGEVDDLIQWAAESVVAEEDTIKAAVGLNMAAESPPMNPEAEAHYRLQALNLAGDAETVDLRIRRAMRINQFVLYGKEPNDG